MFCLTYHRLGHCVWYTFNCGSWTLHCIVLSTVEGGNFFIKYIINTCVLEIVMSFGKHWHECCRYKCLSNRQVIFPVHNIHHVLKTVCKL